MLQCDPQLEKLVDDTYAYAQRLITPEERAKLAALVPGYEAATKPAARHEIDREIGTLALGYPAAKVSDAEADARLTLYAQALADVPADVLASACFRAVQEHTFYPSIAEIRAKCGEMNVRLFRLARIKHLIAKHDSEYRAPEPLPELSEADREEMVRLRKKFGLGDSK